ncbi:MAG: molybdate ABC transporter substrate-binding protein [Roseivirga sp.]|nr:molybdate ABC transporter substrate-binding protein [Roseivirga sp.]
MALIVACLFSCHQKKTNKLIIATAANMQFAMIELTETFSKKTGIECETILGSSGKLTAQIVAGAPYDIFVSADMKYPEELYQQGLTRKKPEAFATGRLVLWTMENESPDLTRSLREETLSHIAIANPKTAPYGRAAMETLEALGLTGQAESKLVYGESIAQTNQFITSQAAQIGFTAKSVVLAPGLRDKGSWIDIPPDYHSPLLQGIVTLKNNTGQQSGANEFYEFLFSAEAKEILNKFGYSSIQ